MANRESYLQLRRDEAQNDEVEHKKAEIRFLKIVSQEKEILKGSRMSPRLFVANVALLEACGVSRRSTDRAERISRYPYLNQTKKKRRKLP